MIFESLIALYSQTKSGGPQSLLAGAQPTQLTSQVSEQICQVCLTIIPQLIKARERTKTAFKDSIERIITNIRMYLDVFRPRNFDAPDLATEIPSDLAYYFCYNNFEANASEAGKLLIKDVRGAGNTNNWTGLT